MAKKQASQAQAPAAPEAPAVKEDRAAAFRRLAGKRVNRTCHAIRLIGNLSNKSSYDYTEEQVVKLMTALSDAVEHVGNAFAKGVAKSQDVTF